MGELDGASFRCGLNACVAVGRIDEANSLLKFMVKQGLAPGIGSYNIIIKFYCGAGGAAHARAGSEQTQDRVGGGERGGLRGQVGKAWADNDYGASATQCEECAAKNLVTCPMTAMTIQVLCLTSNHPVSTCRLHRQDG